MKLYSITDGYIDYLHREHAHVYSNKENIRAHSRKYIGVVLEVNGFNYYVPLSSPKDKDFEMVNGVKKIKKDTFMIFRIKSKEPDGNYSLKGTLQFAAMIPVPDTELELYDIENEPDINYKNLVQEELVYIRKNKDKILKRASLIHHKKTSNASDSILSVCLDFSSLEDLCDAWKRLVS